MKACLFPAFVIEYMGCEEEQLKKHGISLTKYLKEASDIVGFNITMFDIATNNFLDNELVNQYITFVFSCALSDCVSRQNVENELVAGYSMGLYAALYHCSSINISEGLQLIQQAFSSVTEKLSDEKYAMASVIGLKQDEMRTILNRFPSTTEIINTNSEVNFILSGKTFDIQMIVEAAKEEGALNTRYLPVGCPYHSSILKSAGLELGRFAESLNVKRPETKLISGFDQRVVVDKNDVIAELSNNLYTTLNWLKTFTYMVDSGYNTFFECGAGNALYRLGKFIPGDFEIYTCKKLSTFLEK